MPKKKCLPFLHKTRKMGQVRSGKRWIVYTACTRCGKTGTRKY